MCFYGVTDPNDLIDLIFLWRFEGFYIFPNLLNLKNLNRTQNTSAGKKLGNII